MSRKKQRPAPPPPSPLHLSRLAQERKRERITLLVGAVAIFVVLATVGFGYSYISILPRWETVATVNGTAISTGYYASLLRLIAGPTPSNPSLLTTLALQRAIEAELVVKRASSLGVSVGPQELDEYLQVPPEPKGSTSQSTPEERYRRYLQQVGFSRQGLRRMAEVSLLENKLLDYFSQQVPKEAEHAHLFAIVVESEEQAKQVVERLKAGEDFGAVATEVSLDTASKDKGGELGWVPRGVLNLPQLEEAAFALEPGTLSDPIIVSERYYIAKVAAREVREVSEGDRGLLEGRAWQQWLEEQRGSSQIVESLTPRRQEWAVARVSR